MADPHLVSTLDRQFLETEALLSDYRQRLADARRNLVHLGATIALFEQDANPDEKERPMSFIRMFQRGEVFKVCCDAIALHPGGLDTSELALICLRAKGLDESDKLLRRGVAHNIIQTMGKRRDRGDIVSTEKRGVARIWRLP